MFDNLMLIFFSLFWLPVGVFHSVMSLCMCISDDIEVAAIAIDAATILEIKGKRWSHYHSNQVYTLSLVRHMPPMYLQRSRRYRLAYCSRTNENMGRRQLEPSQSFTAVMPAKLSSSQLRRHANDKDWDDQCCRPLMFSYRNSIPGSTGGYVAGASAAYENQALVEQWRQRNLPKKGRKNTGEAG